MTIAAMRLSLPFGVYERIHIYGNDYRGLHGLKLKQVIQMKYALCTGENYYGTCGKEPNRDR
ncbi:MAG: hypothetical protein QXM93_08490 [Candidatus Methanomethyliaceae archaeon]